VPARRHNNVKARPPIAETAVIYEQVCHYLDQLVSLEDMHLGMVKDCRCIGITERHDALVRVGLTAGHNCSSQLWLTEDLRRTKLSGMMFGGEEMRLKV